MVRVIYVSLFLLGLARWGMRVHDPDLGWQLVGGDWMWRHGALPGEDVINSLNSDWHNYHWLAQLLLSAIYSVGGFFGLKLSFGILMGLFAVLVVALVNGASGRRPVALLTFLISIVAFSFLASISSIRPQMLALFILALVIFVLGLRRNRYQAPLVFLAALVLANFHVYWIFVALIWAIFRIVPAVVRSRPKRFEIVIFLVLLGVGAINPYGIRAYALLWDYLNLSPTLRETIAEFQSPFRVSASLSSLLVFLFLIVIATYNWKRWLVQSQHVCLAILGLSLGSISIKYLGISALFCIPYVAKFGPNLLRRYAPRLIYFQSRILKFSVGPIACVALVQTIVHFPKFGDPSATQYIDKHYAASICGRIPSLKLQPSQGREHLRLLTHFNQGGWCRWAVGKAAPNLDLRVTLDGRTQYVPDARFRDMLVLYRMQPGWGNILKSLSPDLILVGKTWPLAAGLSSDANWALAMSDENFLIFTATADKI